MASPDWQRILGVRFFDGAAPEAVDYITRVGGYTVVPAAPALVKIENDPAYRRALELTPNPIERRFIEQRLAELRR